MGKTHQQRLLKKAQKKNLDDTFKKSPKVVTPMTRRQRHRLQAKIAKKNAQGWGYANSATGSNQQHAVSTVIGDHVNFTHFENCLRNKNKSALIVKRLNNARSPLKAKSSRKMAKKKPMRTWKKPQSQNDTISPCQPDSTNMNNPQNGNKPKARNINATIEEGEIVSDNEHSNRITSMSDDCICIETEIEQIVIDDDTTIINSSQDTVDFKKFSDTQENRVSSTPHVVIKHIAPSSDIELLSGLPNDATLCSASNDVENKKDSPPLFFEDTRRGSCENNNFVEYIKLPLLGERSKPKRRSSRIEDRLRVPPEDTSDVIFVDETHKFDLVNQPPVKRLSTDMDDSVIFVQETAATKIPEYISLNDANVPNPISIDPSSPYQDKKLKKKSTKHSANSSLFSASELKQLQAYKDNAFDPKAGNRIKTPKRMVFLDGSNLAFHHGLHTIFSVKGIQIALEHFDNLGHEVKAVVPLYRKNKGSDPDMVLEGLYKKGKVVFTPCKNLHGKSSNSYDDRFLIQMACDHDAAIVSNDNYRDLIDENSAFKKIIENRVISYTWCNDYLMLAKDPYGRWGPQLHSILNRV